MKKYLFIALVAFLAVTSASAQLRIKMGKNSPIEKLGRAEIAITNLYVDSVDENKLVEDAIRGMLESSTLILLTLQPRNQGDERAAERQF